MPTLPRSWPKADAAAPMPAKASQHSLRIMNPPKHPRTRTSARQDDASAAVGGSFSSVSRPCGYLRFLRPQRGCALPAEEKLAESTAAPDALATLVTSTFHQT